jgi:hypothetical protein
MERSFAMSPVRAIAVERRYIDECEVSSACETVCKCTCANGVVVVFVIHFLTADPIKKARNVDVVVRIPDFGHTFMIFVVDVGDLDHI